MVRRPKRVVKIRAISSLSFATTCSREWKRAGARVVFIILRSGKWDIADYYGDGSRLGLRLAYLVMGDPYGPHGLVAAAEFPGVWRGTD
jgi:hypothetical protein